MESARPALESNRLATPRVAVRTCMAAIAFVRWFALALQFYLMVIQSQAQDTDRFRLTVNYFSFFTILTNLLVAMGLTLWFAAPNSQLGRFFARPVVASGTAVYIAIVAATYSLLLRSLWNPQGAQKLADIVLHDFVPVIYVAYWLIFIPKSSLRWKDIFYWLFYPLGYARVLANAAMLVCSFLAVALLAVAIGRWMDPNSPVRLR